MEHDREVIADPGVHRLSGERRSDSMTTGTESVFDKQNTTGDLSPDTNERIRAGELPPEEATDDPAARLMRDLASGNPFPEVPGAPAETQFTFRALLTGAVLGALVGASDMYLGLKSGNTIGGGSFGALAGYVILSSVSRILPTLSGSEPGLPDEAPPAWGTKLRRFFKLGGPFGPKENITIMCTATAAASNGIVFFTAIPALYRLGFLSASPRDDMGRLITLSLICAYWGMFFSVPLRKFYILEQKLPFPGATATAVTIRTLHASQEGGSSGKKRVRYLLYAFVGAMVWKVCSAYAPGVLYNHHVAWGLYKAGWTSIVDAENWYWYIQWSPAFIGLGMIMGPNTVGSIAIGQILAWGLIGPALVSSGRAVGQLIVPGVPQYKHVKTYLGSIPSREAPSPYYWLIWPGLLVLLTSTFVELGCNGKAMALGVYRSVGGGIKRAQHDRKMRKIQRDNEKGEIYDDYEEPPEAIWDPAPRHERAPMPAWLTGAFVSGFLSCVVLAVQYDMAVGLTILATLFGLLFSFIAAETTGRLALNLGSIGAAAAQFIFMGIAHAKGYTLQRGVTAEIFGSAISMAASQQTGDMLSDLKATHLLNASPRSQFYAQVIGAIPAIFISPGLFVLFADTYPCILAADTATLAGCTYKAPASIGYTVLAAIGLDGLIIPRDSGIFAILFAALAAAVIIAKYVWIPQRYHGYVPSFLAISLGFVLPQAYYCITFIMGAVVIAVWKRKSPMGAVLFGFPIAAGLVSGEGIGGVITAILDIAGVGASEKGSKVGCPWGGLNGC